MPPRRSTRTSLPLPSPLVPLITPARKAPSNASSSSTPTPTPALSASKSSVTTRRGPITPGSMSDDGTEVSEATEESMEEVEIPVMNGRKRKESSPQSSPFTTSPTSETKKLVLESVTVPARRSRLGQEQTTSSDNLTLGSSQAKRSRSTNGVKVEQPEPSSDPLGVISPLESTIPKTANGKPSKPRASTRGQPFSVGTFSSVKKASSDSLRLTALDVKEIKSELGSDSSASTPASKRTPRFRRSAKKEPSPSATESDFALPVTDDFALDSDEEAAQLKAAIKASAMKGVLDRLDSATPTTSNMQTPLASSSAGPSRDSSVPPPRGRGAGGRKKRTGDFVSAKDVLMGKKASGKAAIRAVKVRGGAKRNDSGISTPLDSISDFSEPEDDDSDFEGSSPSESALSELSSISDDDSGSNAAPLAKKRKWQPKTKTQTRKSAVKEESDLSEEESDEESNLSEAGGFIVPKGKGKKGKKGAKVKREKKPKKEQDEKMSSIKKAEAELKAELGRKLTNGEKNIIRLVRHHPELRDVWGDLAVSVKPIKPVTMEAHPSLKLKLLPFQKESLYWMKKQEEGVWKGGMLADEMGMGKTIQTIALLLSEPRRKPSLVVAPVVALMQWKHEIENNTDGFSVCVWHGSGRMKAKELQQFDVVLVSYGTLEASFRRQQRGFKRGDLMIKEKSPMHTFEWYRVILDEAHNIKERSTNAAKAAFALESQYKWCLSGTPLQNRVGELYSLVRFLGADPFSHYFCKKCDCKSLHWKFTDKRHCDECKHKPMDHVCFWNTEILTPIARYGIESGNPGHTAFKKLKILLDRMMLRRTKLERADDLGLPPRTIVVRRDYFSPEEKELYMSLFTGAKRQFATYVDQGTVLNNYSNIFSLITRMRQMACHPDLVLKSKTSALGQNVEESTVCRICNDTAEDAIVSQCKHLFDRECIRQYLEVQQLRGHRPECPVCHIEISIDLEAEAVDLEDMPNNRKARQGILSRLNLDNWRSSSKLEALVEELEKLRNKDCTIKSLVFSQFVSFLDLIAFRLQRAGFTICRLEGGMTPQQRDATIQHFMKNTNVTVFLISLKAGGVALNLTEASMVFMMDSWWNPSVEYQAMDRIHRLGQKRPVKVIKLVVEDSIEDQIVQLQHKKLAMTEAALSTDPDAALGKLTVEDLGFLFKM